MIVFGTIHQECAHLAEKCSLQGLGQDVSPHLFGGAIFEIDIMGVVTILDEEVFRADVLSAARAGDTAVLFQRKRAHVVLEDNVGFDGISLGLKEIMHPEDVTEFIVDGDQFGLGGALGVDSLLA